MILAIILVVASCIASIQCAYCLYRKCPFVPRHYEELSCKAIKDNGDCVTRFECPDFASYDSSKCYYKGKVYNVGDKVDDNEVALTRTNCTCRGRPAKFSCARRICPKDMMRGDHYCLNPYSSLHRCPEKQICDPKEIAELARCRIDYDITMLSGQLFSLDSLHTCLCTDDFDNTTAVADNVRCEKTKCPIDLLRLDMIIHRGCVPIYFSECDVESCPSGRSHHQCPTDNDQLKESDIDDNSVGPTCTFGKLTLRIGQQLRLDDDKCVECKCTIPPMITCSFDTDCLNSRASK